MKTSSTQLLHELKKMTEQTLNELQDLKSLADHQLNFKPNKDRWSILECIEHLNRYGEFYLPEINKRISNSSSTRSDEFKSGLLGNYFAKMMLPGEKMKTFKDKDPSGSTLDKGVLDTFEDQLHELMTVLKKAENMNLTRIKTNISISNFLKLRLGDTLRVVIYHNHRHMQQALEIQKDVEEDVAALK